MSPSKSYRKSTNYGDGRSLAQYRAHSMSGAISRRSTRDIYNMEPSTSTRSKSSTRFRKSDASDRMLRTSGMSNNGRSRTSVSPVKSQRSVRAITTPSTHRRQLSSSNLQGQPSVRATRPLDSRHSLRSRRFVTSMMNVKAETNKNNPGEGPFHVLKSENIAPNVEPQDSSVAATPEFISPKATVVHTTPLPSAPTTKREHAGSKLWSALSSPGGISVDAQVKRANELIQRQKLKKEKSRLRRLSLDDFGGESNQSSTQVQKEGDEMTSTPEAMERTPSQSSRNVFAALSRRFTKLSTGASAGTETKEPHSERAGRKGGDRHFQSTTELVEDGRQTHAPSLENPDGTGLHEESHFGLPNDETFNESEARTSSPTRWSPTKAAKWMTRKGQKIATNATGRFNEQRRILLDDNEED